ncbi:MAG: acetyl-CoA C-acetyltransferase [Planctomycetota bacterium]
MNDKNDVVIVGGKRTPMAEYCGTPGFGKLKDFSANDLGGFAIEAALKDAGVKPEVIDHVVMGNAMQTSADAHYGARHSALKAGIPIETPALTVNRICGSGVQSVVNAAQMLKLGEATVTVAGGMESMSQAPFCVYGQHVRQGIRFGTQPTMVDYLFSGLQDSLCETFMAQTADKAATQSGISREECDAFALRSHQLGAKAVEAGIFSNEIEPIRIQSRRGEKVVDSDDHIKPDTTLEGLAKLRPAFGKEGFVTAGNASGIVDGAAALIVTTREKADAMGLEVQATIRGWNIVGVDPTLMSIGPVPAIKGLWEKTGIGRDDVDLYEINEAFAPQYLACEKELGLDRERCNVNGGAIALGHPLGATGTRLLLTLMHELARRKGRYGVASACIGGGQGIAMLIDRS